MTTIINASISFALTIALAATTVGCGSKTKKDTVATNQKVTGSSDAKSKPAKAANQPVAVTGVKKDGSLVSFDPIYFEFDEATIREDSRDGLESIAKHMTEFPKMTLTIEGHTDDVGTTEYNIALGDRRARAIQSYLVRLGVGEPRLRIVSYGKEQPAASGDSDDARAKNRRGEFNKKTQQ